MINFAALEENIANHGQTIGDLGSTLRRLETQVATLVSKAVVSEFESRSAEAQAKMQRAIDQLNVTLSAQAGVVEQMPTIQAELVGRMTEIETRLSTDLSELNQKVLSRFGSLEGDVHKKCNEADVEKMRIDVAGRVKHDEMGEMQSLVSRVRDEAANRIDSVSDRTFAMRKELDAALDSMRHANTQIKARIDERTVSLEEQGKASAAFLARSEKALSSKVATEELHRVTEAWEGQLTELRAVLQAQMDVVRNRAERGSEDFQSVVDKISSVAMRHELEPLGEHIASMQTELGRLSVDVGGKAEEAVVAARIDSLAAQQAEHTLAIGSKADAAELDARHASSSRETVDAIASLREATDQLGASIGSVDESVKRVAAQAHLKAETRDVRDMMGMIEGVQEQVTGLKTELQGTLKALETWIVEQNKKKSTKDVKPQPRPPDSQPASANPSPRQPQGIPANRSRPQPGQPGQWPPSQQQQQLQLSQQQMYPQQQMQMQLPQQQMQMQLPQQQQQMQMQFSQQQQQQMQMQQMQQQQMQMQQMQMQQLQPLPPSAMVATPHAPAELLPAPQTSEVVACSAGCVTSEAPSELAAAADARAPAEVSDPSEVAAQGAPSGARGADGSGNAAATEGARSQQVLKQRVGELERQMAGLQALLLQSPSQPRQHAAGGKPTGGGGPAKPAPPPQESPFANEFTVSSTAVAAAMPYGASAAVDASGAFVLPTPGPGYGASAGPPRAAHKKAAAGPQGSTVSSQHMATKREDGSQGRRGGEGGGANSKVDGPPFRSQGDRKQWLLQEKRRWLVEMRLGRRADATDGETDHPPAEKLPPISHGSGSLPSDAAHGVAHGGDL